MRLPAVMALAVTVLLGGAASALAFQQEQAAPIEEPSRLAPSDADAALTLGTAQGNAAAAGKQEAGGLLGLGLWSKLNFGLDLLYSQEPNDLEQSNAAVDEEQDDVSVLAKIKRLF
jgi:hypothetical protein